MKFTTEEKKKIEEPIVVSVRDTGSVVYIEFDNIDVIACETQQVRRCYLTVDQITTLREKGIKIPDNNRIAMG